MFWKKKPPLPSICHVEITFNIGGIRDWLKQPCEIGIDKRPQNQDETIINGIDTFPKEDLYYHRQANQFSHLIAGTQYIDKHIGYISWSVCGPQISFTLADHDLLIARFPLHEIQTLVVKGAIISNNARADMDGKSLKVEEPEGFCNAYMRRGYRNYGLLYSNDLVSFRFTTMESCLRVGYPEATSRH